MARIPREFINDLMTRIDIVEVIRQHIQVKKAGSNYSACCPFHQEKTPSFSISPTKQFYYCFGCGAHGNAISFLMAYSKITFIEAVQALAQEAGVSIPQSDEPQAPREDFSKLYACLEEIKRYYCQNLKQSDFGKTAIEYLKKRGLSGKVCAQYAVGVALPGWDNVLKKWPQAAQELLKTGMIIKNDKGRSYDRFRARIMFPIRNKQGKVVGFGGRVLQDETPKYLNSPETPIFHKGKGLYGLYEALQNNRNLDYLLVVEGYMDVVSLAQFGITQAVATLGTAVTGQHIIELFKATTKIIFCFDGDAAGQKAAARALENCLPQIRDDREIQFIFMPAGEDPDSLLRSQGEAAFLTMLGNAQPLSEVLFAQLAQNQSLHTSEGRAQWINRAKPLLAKIPQCTYRNLLLQKYAKLLHLDEIQLQKMLAGEVVSLHAPLPARKTGRPLTPFERLIALILQVPDFARKISTTELPLQHDPAGQLLAELCKLIEEHPGINTGTLLEYCRGHERRDWLMGLLQVHFNLDPQALAEEFMAVLQHFKQQESALEKEQTLQMLAAKPLDQLTEEEKEQLKQMVSRESGAT